MIKVPFTRDYIIEKISESYAKDFAKANGLEKLEGTKKSVYIYKGEPTYVGAYSNAYEIRQLPVNVDQVLCYNREEDTWKFFKGEDELIRKKPTRHSAAIAKAEHQTNLIGGIVVA